MSENMGDEPSTDLPARPVQPLTADHRQNLALLCTSGVWREQVGVFSIEHETMFRLLSAARDEGRSELRQARVMLEEVRDYLLSRPEPAHENELYARVVAALTEGTQDG